MRGGRGGEGLTVGADGRGESNGDEATGGGDGRHYLGYIRERKGVGFLIFVCVCVCFGQIKVSILCECV